MRPPGVDLGEPVKTESPCGIADLATDLIRLSGLEPGQDIEVVFTEIRPGERLNEQLFAEWEQPQRTAHPRISVARAARGDNAKLRRDLVELEAVTQAREAAQIKAKLQEIVPEYMPESR